MEFVTVRNLGTGGVGSVDLINVDGNNYALKTIAKKGHNYYPEHVANEIKAGRLAQHSNIAALYKNWEDKQNVYLLMEYVNGWDLFGLIDSLNGSISEKSTRQIFRQIIEAIKHLHSKGIAHRDIKLDNIMVDAKLKVKIIDLGLCQVSNATRCSEKSGSPEYWAPEVTGMGRYNALHADIWSLGIVLYAMLYGSFPFTTTDINKIRIGSPIRLPFHASPDVSVEAKNLISSLLQSNPKRRISVDEILNHEFFTKE